MNISSCLDTSRFYKNKLTHPLTIKMYILTAFKIMITYKKVCEKFQILKSKNHNFYRIKIKFNKLRKIWVVLAIISTSNAC